ncbi:hypothetical protein ACS0TY_012941 [Phlomoides rotata]
MEEEVRCMLENEYLEPLTLLELIDDIHRLGLSYRFLESSRKALCRMSLHQPSKVEQNIHNNLHSCALYFRLLRLHGHHISTDIFESFKDSDGNFNANLAMDIGGMLSLYEASFLAFDGESTLDEAKEFTRFHLSSSMREIDAKSALRVSHALELPLHKRMARLEARWNIEMYDDKKNKGNQLLHKLAISDFNMVQLQHQQDLLEVSRWWKHMGLANKLSFARDRVMECFYWAVGMIPEPQFSKSRIGLAKVINLLMVLDDIYDEYGSPQELQQFTHAVNTWDVNSVNDLPDCMKLYFLAIYNIVNDLTYDTLKEQGQFIIPHLRKGWGDLCKAFLRETKWGYEKHIPQFDDYLKHGCISSTGLAMLTHAYFLTAPTITDEALQSLSDTSGLLCFPSTVFRLANDLCSSKEEIEREEEPKGVFCYMHETGASDEVARSFINKLIDQNWKMMNQEITHNSIFDKSFIEISCNLARVATLQYQYGDAQSAPNDESRNQVKSVIIDPIKLVN